MDNLHINIEEVWAEGDANVSVLVIRVLDLKPRLGTYFPTSHLDGVDNGNLIVPAMAVRVAR